VRDDDAVAMMIIQVVQPYAGLTLSTIPRLPLPVHPGQTALVQVLATAVDCARIPGNDQLPFLDVTFGNARAVQSESEILGARYTADLHRAMDAACHRS
jgi:hypothetical protein